MRFTVPVTNKSHMFTGRRTLLVFVCRTSTQKAAAGDSEWAVTSRTRNPNTLPLRLRNSSGSMDQTISNIYFFDSGGE